MNKAKPGRKSSIYTWGFLDESGLLNRDKFFGLGLLKIYQPQNLHKKIVDYKQKGGFTGEYKFSDVRDSNLMHYRRIIDIYFGERKLYFSAMVFDKKRLDLKKYHKDSTHKAYNAFMARLISDSLKTSEYMSAVADDVTTPKDDKFEKEVKKKVKKRVRRSALIGILRAESHAFTELQVVDVLLGSVMYAFKIRERIINPDDGKPKQKLMRYIQKHLNEPLLSRNFVRKMRGFRAFTVKEWGTPNK